MLRDFGVVLGIPEGRLCPPVPNRMNYVLWIQDIVCAHLAVLGSKSSSGQRKIRGLDIGTGSTAIYPLLACKLEPEWEIVGTELDDFSYEYALTNVESNNLQSSIQIMKASTDKLILFPLEEQTFDFCMCNPPFYASKEEIERSAEGKELPPNAVCTGADIEMIYPQGGEEGFVGRMVEESERFGVRCKWYTSMLGKMSSVSTIVGMLKERSITNYAITEFVQGQTRRWAVGWSLSDERLPDTTARIPNISPKHPLHALMPSRNTLTQSIQLAPSASASGSEEAVVINVVREVLDALDGVSVSLVRASSTGRAAPAEAGYSESASAIGSAGGPDAPDLVESRGGARFAGPTASISTSSAIRSHRASTPSSLPETTEMETANMTWLVEATENTWSRSARRKNKSKSKVTPLHSEDQLQQQHHQHHHQQEASLPATSESGPVRSAKTNRILREQQGDEEEARVRKTEASSSSPRPALTCSVRVSVSSAEATSAAGAVDVSAVSYNGGGGDGEVSNAANAAEGACAGAAASRTLELELEFQWIYGSDSDRALFESFAGHVGRKVGAVLKRV